MSLRFAAVCGVVIVGAFALPALASHGKAGLWETTTTNENATQMALPPEALAQMNARGMKLPESRAFTSRYCMTAEEVAADAPPPMRGNACKLTGTKIVGQTFSADVTCTGTVQGTSHFSISYDSAEHYSGESEFTGSEGGQPFHSKTRIEGRWISPDCGDVKPHMHEK
jgi:hypothetical protein